MKIPMFVQRNRTNRLGTTLTELIVSAGLLATATSLVATSMVGDRRLQRLQHQHEVAVDELSNQLEQLRRLTADDIAALAEPLALSAWASDTLPSATLTATPLEDELGDRIRLQLDWPRPGNPPPLTATAWLIPNVDEPQPNGDAP